jgi:hypothetical protein
MMPWLDRRVPRPAVPSCVVGLSSPLLGEGFGPLKVVGALLTIGGVILVRRMAAKPAAQPLAEPPRSGRGVPA